MEKGVKMLHKQCETITTQTTEVKGQGKKNTKQVKLEVKVTTEKETKTNKQNGIENVITNKTVREHKDSAQSESTVKSEHSRDADVDIRIENEDGDVVKNKKRRKRKKKLKTKTDGAEVTVDLHNVDEKVEEMFDMDFSSDEELTRLTSNLTAGSMSRSISLPVTEENKLERTNEWASAHEGFSYLNSHPFSDTDLSPLAR